MSTNPIPENDLCEDLDAQAQEREQQPQPQDPEADPLNGSIITSQDSTTIPDISSVGEIRTLLDSNASIDNSRYDAVSSYLYSYVDNLEAGQFNTTEPDIDDYFRRLTGRYWGWSNNRVEYVHKDIDETKIIIGYELIRTQNYIHDPDTIVELFRIKIPTLFAHMSYYSGGNETKIWSDLIKHMVAKLYSKEFTDHSFKVASPVQRRDIDAVIPFPNLLYANVNPTYNFYIPSYESAAVGISESLLPSMYTFISQMLHDENDEEATINPLFKKHVTLDNKIEIGDLKKMTTAGGVETEVSGQYFDIYSKKYNEWSQNKPPQSVIESKFKNQLVSHSNVNLLKDYNNKKELFPMFVDIKFSTDTNTEFAEILKDTEMGCVLMKEVVQNGNKKFKQFREFLETSEKSNDPLKRHGKRAIRPDGSHERNILDISDWFDNISNMSSGQASINNLSAVFLGDVREIVNDPKYKFFKSLMTMLLNGKISQLKKKYKRTYNDVLNGKLAHSETVAYRIEKKSGNTHIQNFYLPNSNEINIHNFIDTQVKYGKEYTYNIYALQVVYGTSYKTFMEYKLNDGYLTVYSKPSIKIVEVPYYDYTNRLLDSPPVQPNVEVVPFKGIDNRIKINLSSNTGKYDLHPIALEASEEEENRILKLSQDRLPDEPLQFESDDHSAMFEVYRVDKYPSEYSDFSKNKISVLNAGSATAASMIDNVLPNKKYWYIFRSIDNHGHTSYPSPVYQVEVVNADGTIYPLISVVDFKVIDPRLTSRKLKRMMQIAPAFPQTILNTEELDQLETIKDRFNDTNLFKLGIEDEKLWKKKFKIRLISKKTGKKVDINIQFNHEHLKIDPESD